MDCQQKFLFSNRQVPNSIGMKRFWQVSQYLRRTRISNPCTEGAVKNYDGRRIYAEFQTGMKGMKGFVDKTSSLSSLLNRSVRVTPSLRESATSKLHKWLLMVTDGRMVPEVGLEPTWALSPPDFESGAYTNFATPAWNFR